MYKVINTFYGTRQFFETFQELMRFWAYRTVTFDGCIKVNDNRVLVFEDGVYVQPYEMKVAYEQYNAEIHKRWQKRMNQIYVKRYKFRDGPVEGISCAKWRFGNYYRTKMKTKQERSRVDEYTRGKRRKLPNSWDDILCSTVGNNNWKRYRKHQWKEK
ncbi:hypothetical protein phiOC_p081 [Ochrobactrum phage vB_OspM_OC]|nr:hypothetical protein phiOC_p081 [Ochrobactrum phage vB_OspM_OC]